jgi:hypothetical protein
MQELIKKDEHTFPSGLFTDSKNLVGKNCHKQVLKLIKDAARKLPGVVPSDSEKQLCKNPKWRPDVRLFNPEKQCLGVIEYESLNSSDERVISKDAYGYEGWIETLEKPVPPLLIITTLLDVPDPNYQLLWATCYPKKGYCDYNIDHKKNIDEIRRNPFKYWYAHYRLWLEHRIRDLHLPISFANFSGNKLSLVRRWPVPAAPYQPHFDDGSDRSKMFDTSDAIQELRKAYKKKLWAESDLAKLKVILAEYWSREQSLWGAKRCEDKYFTLWLKRLRNREEACRWIEKVQWAKLY